MSVLAFASQKGGVGKTTLALNLAYALANRSWKTLLIDTDPQGGVGHSLGAKAIGANGLMQLLRQNGKPPENGHRHAHLEGGSPLGEIVLQTRVPELSLLPFGQLPVRDLPLASGWLTDGTQLSPVIAECRDIFDLVLIDTPAGLGGITAGVLRIADFLVSPLQAEPLALRTIPQLMETVADLRDQGYGISIAGLVPTMVHSRQDVSLATTQEAFRMFPGSVILEAFVPRDEHFLEASAEGVPLGLLRRRPPAVALVFDQIAAELEPRLALISEDEKHEPISLLD